MAGDHMHQQDTSLFDTVDCVTAEEAVITRVPYILGLLNQIPGVPIPQRMGPRPLCPVLGMDQYRASATAQNVDLVAMSLSCPGGLFGTTML